MFQNYENEQKLYSATNIVNILTSCDTDISYYETSVISKNFKTGNEIPVICK